MCYCITLHSRACNFVGNWSNGSCTKSSESKFPIFDDEKYRCEKYRSACHLKLCTPLLFSWFWRSEISIHYLFSKDFSKFFPFCAVFLLFSSHFWNFLPVPHFTWFQIVLHLFQINGLFSIFEYRIEIKKWRKLRIFECNAKWHELRGVLKVRNTEPGTQHPEPGTRNPELGTWNLEPRTHVCTCRRERIFVKWRLTRIKQLVYYMKKPLLRGANWLGVLCVFHVLGISRRLKWYTEMNWW